MKSGFLPTSAAEMKKMGWRKVDIVIVTGDAYIDHPFFEYATIGSFLMNNGFKVAIIDNPATDEDFMKFGKPTLFFYVDSGAMDSMVSNYTPYKKYKSTDPYLPKGERANRPDRATIKYVNKVKQLYKGVLTLIGGVEASARRFAHYDFWVNKVRKPILFDSKADMLLFGNKEFTLLNICRVLKSNKPISVMKKIPGTAYISGELPNFKFDTLPDYEAVVASKKEYLHMVKQVEKSYNPISSLPLIQKVMNRYLIVNKYPKALTVSETNRVFNAMFQRKPSPKYKDEIPAFNNMKDVIITHRGGENCPNYSQNAIVFGRDISFRSVDSILKEAKSLSAKKDFNSIFRLFESQNNSSTPLLYGTEILETRGYLKNDEKTFENDGFLRYGSRKILEIFTETDRLLRLRNNFYAKNVNFEYLLNDSNLFKDFVMKRCGTVLIINLGSCNDRVRKLMGLCKFEKFLDFYKEFKKRVSEYGKKIELKVEVMAGYPGETINSVVDNILILKELGITIDRVYSFVPLPSTIATAQYYTGKDLFSRAEITIPTINEKNDMNTLYRFDKKSNKAVIIRLMRTLGREDEIDKVLYEKNERFKKK